MWGRNKKNINTVAFYKKLDDKKNKTVAEEVTLFEPKYYPFNLLEWTEILHMLLSRESTEIFCAPFFLKLIKTLYAIPFPDLLSLSMVDKQARLNFVNGNRYRGMFFNSVYNGRVNALTEDISQLKIEFGNYILRQEALAERKGLSSHYDLAYYRRKCLVPQFMCFSSSAGILLILLIVVSPQDGETSLDRARDHDFLINGAISFGVIVALGALVSGLLKYSILRVRPYSDKDINFFVQKTETLQSSLPLVSPENQAEWEAAFGKLMALENRVDKKLDHLRRLSDSDVEGQRGMDERASLVRNRF
ncbi:MAG TPA: hypothetical protein VFU82_04040 [Gammaproteobacteria bacterium]|nr:hypothetical protein [Gammaproteobacteria bacterium]